VPGIVADLRPARRNLVVCRQDDDIDVAEIVETGIEPLQGGQGILSCGKIGKRRQD
jgi:hypothetical protein